MYKKYFIELKQILYYSIQPTSRKQETTMKFKFKALKQSHRYTSAIPDQVWENIGLFNQELPEWLIKSLDEQNDPDENEGWPNKPELTIRESKLLWLAVAYQKKPADADYLKKLSSRFKLEVVTIVELAIIFGNIEYFKRVFDRYLHETRTNNSEENIKCLQRLFSMAAVHSNPKILSIIASKLSQEQVEAVITKSNSVLFSQVVETGNEVVIEQLLTLKDDALKQMLSAKDFRAIRKAIEAGHTEIVVWLIEISEKLGITLPDNLTYAAFDKAFMLKRETFSLLAIGTVFTHAASNPIYRSLAAVFATFKIDNLITEAKKNLLPFDLDEKTAHLVFQFLEFLVDYRGYTNPEQVSFLINLPSIKALIDKSKEGKEYNHLFYIAAKSGNVFAALELLDNPEAYPTEDDKFKFIAQFDSRYRLIFKDKINTKEFKKQKFVHTKLTSIAEEDDSEKVAESKTSMPPPITNLAKALQEKSIFPPHRSLRIHLKRLPESSPQESKKHGSNSF